MKYDRKDYEHLILKDVKPGSWVVFGLSPRTASVPYEVTDQVDQKGRIACRNTKRGGRIFFHPDTAIYKRKNKLIDVLNPDIEDQPDIREILENKKRSRLIDNPVFQLKENEFNPLIHS